MNGLRDVPAVWWAIGAIITDRAVTLPLWAYEANPLVTGIGRGAWVGVSVVLILGLLVAWYPLNGRSSRLGHGVMYTVTGLHVLAVVSNVAAVAI